MSSEVQDIFAYISRYEPREVELPTKLMPFIPDYVPAVGNIDPFIKVRVGMRVRYGWRGGC